MTLGNKTETQVPQAQVSPDFHTYVSRREPLPTSMFDLTKSIVVSSPAFRSEEQRMSS